MQFDSHQAEPERSPGTARQAAAAFAGLFPPGAVTPIELGGMSAVLRAICPGEITASMTASRRYRLGDPELGAEPTRLQALAAGPSEPVYRRTGWLVDAATGLRAVRVDTIVVLRRLPWHSREPLGLTRAGNPAPGRATIPLGTALSHCSIYRTQAVTALTPGVTDSEDGREQVIHSEALLQGTRPLALLTEQVYADFLKTYPPPWPAIPQSLRQPPPAAAPGRERDAG
jgi:hypothetical protein